MKKEYEILFGEMISLARITDGNEHLITPSSTALLRQCLREIRSAEAKTDILCQQIEAEKRKMVPDCFQCANPCGKTFPFSLDELPEGEIRSLKYAILDALCQNPDVEESLLYHSLTAVLWLIHLPTLAVKPKVGLPHSTAV